jgi:hypothetical protein
MKRVILQIYFTLTSGGKEEWLQWWSACFVSTTPIVQNPVPLKNKNINPTPTKKQE